MEEWTLRRAEYPQRTCRQPVEGSAGQVYSCEIADVHPGPCASQSSRVSLQRRKAWEEQNPGWEDRIGSIDIITGGSGN